MEEFENPSASGDILDNSKLTPFLATIWWPLAWDFLRSPVQAGAQKNPPPLASVNEKIMLNIPRGRAQ